MGMNKITSGDKYQDRRGLLYQVVCVGNSTETNGSMVVYQDLFGKFLIWVKPYTEFHNDIKRGMLHYCDEYDQYLCPQEKEKESSDAKLSQTTEVVTSKNEAIDVIKGMEKEKVETDKEKVNDLLMEFLDASSYHQKLEIITGNRKKLTDRLINEMAISIDCTVEEGPMEDRINNLIICLQTMIRFESRRLR